MAAPVPSYASRQRVRASIALVLSATGGACHQAASPPAIRFLHTFSHEETELFNQTMAERGIAVEASLVPFSRDRQVIGEILRAGTDCPDLIRIDATWLPELVAGGLVVELPRPRTTRDGWRLADELTSRPVEARFASRFATPPTRLAALAGAPALSRASHDALRAAAMLPRQPLIPLWFDDLNAALAAVVAGNARPDEAVAGVQRAWQRLTRRAPL